MDYEKKYKEALERAKYYREGIPDRKLENDENILDYIFPELKESEDERIRKELLDYLNERRVVERLTDTIVKEEWIAWLEKQGEQKTIDKVGPKFKVGDFIVYDGLGTYKIIEIHEGWYSVIDNNDKRWSVMFDKENLCHIWTIQDAKDGDVLCGYSTADYPWIGIFHELDDDDTFKSYCYLQGGITGKFCPPSGVNIFNRRNVDGHNSKIVVPATKKQRDILFSKMKEAGYEWDAEKKELNKIEQKSSWSEDDSKIGDIVRSTFNELEHLRNITDSCKSKFLNYFQNKLFERYFFTLYNCFKSNIDNTDIYNVDIIYRSAIKYVKDTMQCTENSFIFVVLNDYLETLDKSYSDLKDEMARCLYT